ncbi:acyltransferase family protein [Modestobacter sp. I12A-02628]|uniref:Acyltransferase n=2 Tax=Goekera deserti TaxID=2497753 RepID=A0A7K3WH20_9ACTN|nr:acyltransferase family protein [Goekera deserti]NDI50360.1 acyltransferase family protein [Goekera deserti]NEL55682.1 acyltransferase [Goekera deserti]
MLRHAAPGVFPGAGVVGVVTFFTLSGYLITGVLRDEHDGLGHVDLWRFYRRRASRLVPPLVALLVPYALVTALLDPLGDRADLPRDLLVALTWTGNLPHLTPGGATFHLWTLATEEQFYLVWPVLLLLCLRRGRPGLAVGVALAVTVAALAVTAWWSADAPDTAYALPTSWAPAFVVGAAARLLCPYVRIPTSVAVVALTGLLGCAVVPLRGHTLTYTVAGPVVAVLAAVLVVVAANWGEVTWVPLTWLVALGTVSYGAYLWNYPLTLWLQPLPGGPLLAALATVAAAAASWRFLERPLSARRQWAR